MSDTAVTRNRICALFFVLTCFVASFPMNAAGNPYNIAGYISPTSLATFGFPPGSSCYDWNNLQTAISYQMVRPIHYLYRYMVPGGDYVADWETYDAVNQPLEWFTQETYSASASWQIREALNRVRTRYWSYHLDRTGGNTVGHQGLPPGMLPQWHRDAYGTHQEQFEAWVTAHPGMIWIMGNEPGCESTVAELGGQDRLTDVEYARFYHSYFTQISSLDPTAQFANGALAMTTEPTWNENFTVANITADWERVLLIHSNLYGSEMPIDIWNMHLYSGHQATDEDEYRGKFVTTIEAFREFTYTTRGGHYAGCPMILTEFNGTYGSAIDDTVRFIQDFKADLSSMWLRGILSEWFWFVSRGTGSWANISILVDSSTLSVVGEAYRDAAVEWQAGAPTAVDEWSTME